MTAKRSRGYLFSEVQAAARRATGRALAPPEWSTGSRKALNIKSFSAPASGIAVTAPFSRFTLGPQPNQEIISITGGPNPTIYLRDQKVTLDQLGPALDTTKREGRSIVIKADRTVSYDLVMAVTNAALERGITPVALATSLQP